MKFSNPCGECGWTQNRESKLYKGHAPDCIYTKAAQYEDLLEAAWTIIANAGEGNWGRESSDWQKAAIDWREKYHQLDFLKGEPEESSR